MAAEFGPLVRADRLAEQLLEPLGHRAK